MEIAFIISFLVALATYFISGSISSFSISLLTIVLGVIFSMGIRIEHRRCALKLFFIVFSVYTIFAILHYLGYYFDYYNFELDWKDEYKFFLQSQLYEKVPLSQIWVDCFVHRVHIENEGYIFYITSLSSVAYSLFDGNHLLYQFLGTTLFGSLTSILMYRFLLSYVDSKVAYNNALIFLLLSVFLHYSIFLLRDIFIAFFYLCGFVIVSQRFSIKGLLALIVLCFIIDLFRYESSLFFIVFIFYYLYLKLLKYKILFIVLSIVIVVISSTFVVEKFTTISRILTNYTELTEVSALSKDDSIGKIVWLLPSPVREVGILINSQIQPFPSWIVFESNKNIFGGIVSFHSVISSFFWFFVIFSIVKWMLAKKNYKKLPTEVYLLFIIAIIFLISNTANMMIRRIMYVYPIFYVVFVILKTNNISDCNVRRELTYSSITYFSIIFVYLIIKYV